MVEWRKQKKDIPGDPLHWWLAWLDKKSQPELAAEAVNMDSGIAAAQARLEELLDDEDFMRMYELREKTRFDWTSGVNHARREGRAEGLQEGRAEGLQEGRAEGIQEGEQKKSIEVAAKMKAAGESAEKIQAFTGLSAEEIEKL